MLNSIPQKRLLLYIILAGLIPIIIAWLLYSSELENVRNLEYKLRSVQAQAFSREKKQSLNMSLRNAHSDTDHFYIDKNLETLSLLEPEIESLKIILDNDNLPADENIKKRLETLVGGGNSLVFTEGVVQSSPSFQDVTETLVHPVEVNIADLQQILCRIEGIPIGPCKPPPNRPQLIILDFRLDKKTSSEKNEVFLLNLKLLKREFL
jgi:hypothetical protein